MCSPCQEAWRFRGLLRLSSADGLESSPAVWNLADKSRNPRQLEALAALFLGAPALLRRAADLLPELLETPFADQALDFSKLLLERALLVPSHRRPFISAAISSLANGILLKDELSANQEEALKCIGEAMSRLRLVNTEEDLKGRARVARCSVSVPP